MVKVKALRTHSYARSNYKRGEEYEILKSGDLKVLLAVKAVEVVEEIVRPAKPVLAVKKIDVPKKETPKPEAEIVAKESPLEVQPEPEIETETRKKRSRDGSYSRRDLRAEKE